MTRRRTTPRRITVFNPGDDSYGIDRVLIRIVGALDRTGYEIDCVLDGDNPGTGWASAALRDAGIAYRKVPLSIVSRSAFGSLPSLASWLIKAMRRLPATARLCRQADVVYVNGFVLIITALAARLARRPVVWHLHELPPGGPWAGRIVRSLSARQICVSHAVAAAFGLTGRSSATVLHNAVDVPDAPVAQRDADSSHPVEIGIVARINQAKGHLVLADAFLELVAGDVPARLHVVGAPHPSDESVASELSRKLADLTTDQVVWAGEVEAGAAYMRRLHVLAAPSTRPDPFPLSVLEGMAAGLAVVASNSGGHPEAIADRETGLLVEPGDSHALAVRLRELGESRELRAALGSAARGEVLQSFSTARFDAGVQEVVGGVDG